MKIEKFGRNRYAVNSYIVFEEKTKAAVLIDPAVNYDQIVEFIEDQKLNLLAIFLTHGHIDHIADTLLVKEKYSVDVYIHKKDNEMLMRPELSLAREFGYGNLSFEADSLMKDEDILAIGPFLFRVIHTPGHTKGGVCLLIDRDMFTGDTLFNGSMGRTDLYGGNEEHMKASLYKLSRFPGEIAIHPGHGGCSTIQYEKDYNPFMRGL
ncbi:MAG: MBL fold metallo-hydrolase [Peptostreptococcaceae bacterium]|nr:MBL fold metallo-hydrolase [Peptostreptococcaceae bacterium]